MARRPPKPEGVPASPRHKGANKKGPKPKLRDLGAKFPGDAEMANFRRHFYDAEQPIVVAILGQGFVEHELDIVLRARLQYRDDASWETLTADAGPISTFSRKIMLGWALGIYDEVTRDDLDIVRKVRNAFAHSKQIVNFDHPLIIDELNRMQPPTRLNAYWRREFAEAKADSDHVERYRELCGTCASELLAIRLRRQQALNRRLNRKLQKAEALQTWARNVLASNPFSGALGVVASSALPTTPSGVAGNFLPPSQSYQSGDPSSQSQTEDRIVGLALSQGPSGKKDT